MVMMVVVVKMMMVVMILCQLDEWPFAHAGCVVSLQHCHRVGNRLK